MKGNYDSLMDLATEVTRIENAKQDYIVPGGKLAMFDDRGLIMSGTRDSYSINPTAHGQIADKMGIPKKYYDRMTEIPGLRAYNVNQWLHRDERQFMVRTLDGNARALLSDKYKPLDNSMVLSGVLETLKGREVNVKSVSLTEKRMFLQIVFPELTREVKVGDSVQYGLTISNSEVSAGSVDVCSMVWRLICANGMIAPSVLNTRHVGRAQNGGEDYSVFADDTVIADQKAFTLKLRDTIGAALNETTFGEMIVAMKLAVEDTITRPEQTIKNVTKRFELSDEMGDLILGNMIQEGNLNRWGIINGITASAKNVESQDRQYDLERLGHQVLTLPKTEWEIIAA